MEDDLPFKMFQDSALPYLCKLVFSSCLCLWLIRWLICFHVLFVATRSSTRRRRSWLENTVLGPAVLGKVISIAGPHCVTVKPTTIYITATFLDNKQSYTLIHSLLTFSPVLVNNFSYRIICSTKNATKRNMSSAVCASSMYKSLTLTSIYM